MFSKRDYEYEILLHFNHDKNAIWLFLKMLDRVHIQMVIKDHAYELIF